MLRDILQGWRAARHNPGFAASAVILVALGVAANATIYSVARSLVFQPLPFKQPDQLVSLWREPVQTGSSFGGSWPHLAEWSSQKQLFEGVAAYIYAGRPASSTTNGSDTGIVSEIQVTEGLFPLLGVHPAIGRLFSLEEELPLSQTANDSAPEPIIVSHEFWTQRFMARPDILGQYLKVGGSTRVIVGVLPPDVRVLRNEVPEVFAPLRPFPSHLSERSMTYLQIVARLRPKVVLDRVRLEAEAYSKRTAQEHPQTDAGMTWKVDTLHERLFGTMRPTMNLLMGTVSFILLIVCVNLAILLLVRASRRSREIAMRAALGASHIRIARQLLAEILMLCLSGGAVGLVLTVWFTRLFAAYSSRSGISLPPATVDGHVIAFTFLISLAAGLSFGAAPALQLWRLDLNSGLKRGQASAGRRSRNTLGGAMVIVEVAASTVLLIGGGLLLRSLIRENQVDPGFRAERVFTLSIGEGQGGRASEAAFWPELLRRAESLPGIKGAAIAGALPLAARQAPESMKSKITLPGQELPAPGFLDAEYLDISPQYFSTMGIPLTRGRTFENPASDGNGVVINERFARERWGGENPVGKQIAVSGGRPYTIIGVVGDVRQYGLRSTPPSHQIYRPLWPSDVWALLKWPSHYLIVRTSGELEAIGPMLNRVVKSMDPERPVILASTMEDVAFKSTVWDRLKTVVTGSFAMTALLLTLVGLYAVISHSVSQRRREIAIRVALGAQRRDIERMVLKQGTGLAAAGLAFGVAISVTLSPLFSEHLFGVAATDLATLAGVSILLGIAALLACYLPLRSAVRVDPATVLRTE